MQIIILLLIASYPLAVHSTNKVYLCHACVWAEFEKQLEYLSIQNDSIFGVDYFLNIHVNTVPV